MEMINYVNKGDTITFPGISLVYLNEQDALMKLREEHQSRSSLINVIFKVKLDLEKGMSDYKDPDKCHGTLKTCFDLDKVMQFYNNNGFRH